jgi:hypothetical protein
MDVEDPIGKRKEAGKKKGNSSKQAGPFSVQHRANVILTPFYKKVSRPTTPTFYSLCDGWGVSQSNINGKCSCSLILLILGSYRPIPCAGLQMQILKSR